MIEFWRNRTNILSNLPPLLDATIPSQYNTSTLLSVMINQLLVEQWSNSTDYGAFFDECAPEYCTYTVTERRKIIAIVTTLIGLVSGLNQRPKRIESNRITE
jgi:hypothetical protein